MKKNIFKVSVLSLTFVLASCNFGGQTSTKVDTNVDGKVPSEYVEVERVEQKEGEQLTPEQQAANEKYDDAIGKTGVAISQMLFENAAELRTNVELHAKNIPAGGNHYYNDDNYFGSQTYINFDLTGALELTYARKEGEMYADAFDIAISLEDVNLDLNVYSETFGTIPEEYANELKGTNMTFSLRDVDASLYYIGGYSDDNEEHPARLYADLSDDFFGEDLENIVMDYYLSMMASQGMDTSALTAEDKAVIKESVLGPIKTYLGKDRKIYLELEKLFEMFGAGADASMTSSIDASMTFDPLAALYNMYFVEAPEGENNPQAMQYLAMIAIGTPYIMNMLNPSVYVDEDATTGLKYSAFTVYLDKEDVIEIAGLFGSESGQDKQVREAKQAEGALVADESALDSLNLECGLYLNIVEGLSISQEYALLRDLSIYANVEYEDMEVNAKIDMSAKYNDEINLGIFDAKNFKDYKNILDNFQQPQR